MVAHVEKMDMNHWWFNVTRKWPDDRPGYDDIFNISDQSTHVPLTTGKMARRAAECCMEVLANRKHEAGDERETPTSVGGERDRRKEDSPCDTLGANGGCSHCGMGTGVDAGEPPQEVQEVGHLKYCPAAFANTPCRPDCPVAVRQALEHADIISERREGEAPNGATADMLVVLAAEVRRLQAAQPPPSTTCPVCNAEFATADQIDANARRAAQPVAPQPVARIGGLGGIEWLAFIGAPLKDGDLLYLAPTPQGDSGRDALLREAREALILARSALGHPDNIAAVQATLAKLDAALPPDLGTA
jgi:hypothetical protein